MKPKNGWEVLSQLKCDPRTSNIPLIVVSMVDQPGMGALLGVDEYLVKPVDKATLLAAIQRRARIRLSPKSTRPILVVEDDSATREFIVEMLTAQGYAVATASDGAQARAQVAANKPELVILDLVLPGASGFELLGEWRASPRTADLPVFILTSKDLTPEEQKFLRANAESLLLKQQPWQEALIKQLSRVLLMGPPEKV
jgi:CheY-like chemotaxis protein